VGKVGLANRSQAACLYSPWSGVENMNGERGSNTKKVEREKMTPEKEKKKRERGVL